MTSLKNKKVIISAGASGIGWATAKVCLEKGATVFICDIDKKYLSKAKKHKKNNKKLFVYECNASNEKEVKDFCQNTGQATLSKQKNVLFGTLVKKNILICL